MNGRKSDRPTVALKDPDANALIVSQADEVRPRTSIRRRLSMLRPLVLGLAGLGTAAYGQIQLSTGHSNPTDALGLYLLGSGMVLAGWAGTWVNQGLLEGPDVQRTSATDSRPQQDQALLTRSSRFSPNRLGQAKRPAELLEERADRIRSLTAVVLGAVYGPNAADWVWGDKTRPMPPESQPSQPVPTASRGAERQPGAFTGPDFGTTLLLIALGLNLAGIALLKGANYQSVPGGIFWFVSLVLLPLALIDWRRERSTPVELQSQGPGRRSFNGWKDWGFPVGIPVALFVFALLIRMYRLGDWTTGIHGDEAEFGIIGRDILSGTLYSPFQYSPWDRFYFNHWGQAMGMAMFGDDLLGSRMFSVLGGALTVPATYVLARLWFGTRVALIAGILVATSSWAIYQSRWAAGISITGLSLVIGCYLLYRALQHKRPLGFVLAAYVFALGPWFYASGRLGPLVAGAILFYLFVLLPFERLTVATRALSGYISLPALTAWRQALATYRDWLSPHLRNVLLFILAVFLVVSPLLAFSLDNSSVATGRSAALWIFNKGNDVPEWYQASHDPLFFGLRLPRTDNWLTMVPIGFEQSGLSVRLMQDGFWPRVLWRQLLTTLSVFTHRTDASSLFPWPDPITKPIEAVLLLVGTAWALSLWRDARMAALSIWFWCSVLALGVLTAGTPNLGRLAGLIPAMAILTALVLDKLVREAGNLAEVIPNAGVRIVRSVRWVSLGIVGAVVAYVAIAQSTDFYGRYLSSYPFARAGSLAYFVGELDARFTDGEGRRPFYVDFGGQRQNWGNPINQFRNPHARGRETTSVPQDLPVAARDNSGVVFIVWPWTNDQLSGIKATYPRGEEGDLAYGRPGDQDVIKYYRVARQEIDARSRRV